MSEATVTAISVRKDGKGFKASLPEYGEVWLSLGDKDAGKVEWKKTYGITFHVKPGERGNFYNVTRVGPAGPPQAASQAPAPLVGGPENINPIHAAMWEKRVSKLIENGMNPSDVPDHVVLCRTLALAGLKKPLGGEPLVKPEFDDNLEF